MDNLLLVINTNLDIERIMEVIIQQGAHLGWILVKACLVFILGKIAIKLVKRLVNKLLNEQRIAPAVRTFVSNLVSILLYVLLAISVIGALGIQTTSFAALIASAGVAIGVGLSGNLSNFTGGLILLIFKPLKIGDLIATSSVEGTVVEVQTFHTILLTADNIRVHVPNGQLSSGYIKNYNVDRRRVEWTFGVDYGVDFDKVKTVILQVLSKDDRILDTPVPLVELSALDASSVNIVVRVWVKASDYSSVRFSVNRDIYQTFNKEGINFPYPQLTVHQV